LKSARTNQSRGSRQSGASGSKRANSASTAGRSNKSAKSNKSHKSNKSAKSAANKAKGLEEAKKAAIMMARARVGDSVNDSSLLATFKTPASGEGTEIDSEVRGGAG
jgi:hypothetical protein